MTKNVFLFSGQGAQYPGMAKEFYDTYSSCKEVFKTANQIFDFNLEDICFNSDEATLSKTLYSQPAIFATSVCAYLAATEKGILASAVAGHSLGEYAAMVAAGVVSIEDGFKLIKARSEAMDKASQTANGAMCAIIGMDSKDIEDICNNIDGYVVPVNYNSAVQTVIAGEADAIDKAIAIFSEKKAKAIKLNVSSAFHSKLMQAAADDYQAALSTLNITFKPAKLQLYSNITGAVLDNFDNMPEYLVKHIVSAVRFKDELELLYSNGYTGYVELGPNKVLTGLVRKTLSGVTAVNIENEKSLSTAFDKLNKE